MTVKELIAELQKLDHAAEVVTEVMVGEFDEIEVVRMLDGPITTAFSEGKFTYEKAVLII